MTIRRLLLILPLIVAVSAVAPIARAQDDASRILAKIRQLDLLNQMVPVLMTSDQIKKLLPAVEKARQTSVTMEKDELAKMKPLEARVDAAIKEAKEKSQVPSREFQAEIILMVNDFRKKRAVMVSEQTDFVLKAVEETLDEGQIKAAANALAVPESEGTKLSERDKLRRWVRIVLLDPYSYDLLVDLSKKK